jgi:hypothetical protein
MWESNHAEPLLKTRGSALVASTAFRTGQIQLAMVTLDNLRTTIHASSENWVPVVVGHAFSHVLPMAIKISPDTKF